MRAYILAIAAMFMAGPLLAQQAFAHAHAELAVSEGHVAGKKIQVVVGHTGEPTYGARPGVHDGKHSLEVLLSDSATSLPLTGASLKADKYYFKDVQSFSRAKSAGDADQVVRGASVAAVFGDAGHYVSRQLQKPGIYGYRIYGNISYFGIESVPIDSTVFCRSDSGNTTKFNSLGWSGGFGCTEDINAIAFPQNTGNVQKTAYGQGGAPVLPTSSAPSKQADTSLWLGIPVAAAAGVLAWKGRKKDGG